VRRGPADERPSFSLRKLERDYFSEWRNAGVGNLTSSGLYAKVVGMTNIPEQLKGTLRTPTNCDGELEWRATAVGSPSSSLASSYCSRWSSTTIRDRPLHRWGAINLPTGSHARRSRSREACRIGFGITHVPATRSREPMGDDLLGGEHFCWNRHGVGFYWMRVRSSGVAGRIWPFATVGVGVLVLAVASRGWITFKIPADFWIRGMQPLLVIAIGLIALAITERSRAFLLYVVGFLAIALLPVSMTSVTSSCASD